jgi:hypothetical protein
MENNQTTKAKTPTIISGLVMLITATAGAQAHNGPKLLSNMLYGLFFNNIIYTANGGLYAKLVLLHQFAYSPTVGRDWHPRPLPGKYQPRPTHSRLFAIKLTN